LAPLGGVYQAGTLSGNPLAVAAGIVALERLSMETGIYSRLELMAGRWAEGLRKLTRDKGMEATVNQKGSMSTLFFTKGPVRDFASASKSDTKLYGAWFRAMLDRGVWLPPSQFETTFFSAGFLFDEVDELLARAESALGSL
jgi:glutamate-1-semialdehyde 2,1-aminomutase